MANSVVDNCLLLLYNIISKDKNGEVYQMENEKILNLILEKLDNLEQGQKEMRGDIKTMQSEIKTMQGDIKTMQSEIKTMQGDIKTMQGDIKTMQGDIENLKKGQTETNSRLERLENKLERHCRESAETAVKIVDALTEEIKPMKKLYNAVKDAVREAV
jgi:septal ring factor EnvC (AmiA/AmiB activator)